MSVILTACRRSKQNAIEKALKKKAAEKKAKREAREARMMAYQQDQGLPSMMMSNAECADTTVWHFILGEETFNISFRMYTGEVFCNGEKIDAIENFDEQDGCCICSYDFSMSVHKARIVTKDGSPNTLTVDGMVVPN